MVKLNRNKLITIIVISSILLLAFLFSIIFSIININNSKILNGISINGIDVSNMTKEEAIKTISNLVQNKINSNIKVYYDEDIEETQDDEMSYETNIEISTLEIEYDISSAVNEAYHVGKTGNIFENNFNILNVLINKEDVELNVSINEENLAKTIANISSNLSQPISE